jgi:hypothetical protein
MCTPPKNLHPREIERRESAETGAGERIFMVVSEHVPKESFPIFEIGNDLDLWH